MDTLLLVIGVNLVVFGATAFGQIRKGLKPFSRGDPFLPNSVPFCLLRRRLPLSQASSCSPFRMSGSSACSGSRRSLIWSAATELVPSTFMQYWWTRAREASPDDRAMLATALPVVAALARACGCRPASDH